MLLLYCINPILKANMHSLSIIFGVSHYKDFLNNVINAKTTLSKFNRKTSLLLVRLSIEDCLILKGFVCKT